MPHFYFLVCDGNGTLLDKEGLELETEAEALQEGKTFARDLIIDDMKAGKRLDYRRIEVQNSDGKVVGIIKLKGPI